MKLAGEGGFKLDAVRNGWTTVRSLEGGMLGLRLLLSCESDKDDGCDFTDEARVPFMAVLHTPASAAAEEGLVACWQSRRTARGRKGFHAKLKALRDVVAVPSGAAELEQVAWGLAALDATARAAYNVLLEGARKLSLDSALATVSCASSSALATVSSRIPRSSSISM